jgi:hypothetical protein
LAVAQGPRQGARRLIQRPIGQLKGALVHRQAAPKTPKPLRGSDVINALLEGYVLLKLVVKGCGL